MPGHWLIYSGNAGVQRGEGYPAPKLQALHSSDKVLTQDPQLFLKFLRNYSVIKVNSSSDIMWISLTLPCTTPNVMWRKKGLHLCHTHTHTHTQNPQNQKLDPSLIKSLPRWLSDEELAHQAGDAVSISWSENPLANSPSIFAWESHWES